MYADGKIGVVSVTDKEAVQVLAILKAAYPNSYKGMTKDEARATATVWAVQFADIPVQVVSIAVNKLISSSPFPPAICEVKNKLGSLYLEAKEMLDSDDRAKKICSQGLSEQKVAFYEAVKRATKDYRCANEPSIAQIVGESKMLLIGGTE